MLASVGTQHRKASVGPAVAVVHLDGGGKSSDLDKVRVAVHVLQIGKVQEFQAGSHSRHSGTTSHL